MTVANVKGNVCGMTLPFSLCWLAIGFWVLADQRRAQRVGLSMDRLRSRIARGLAGVLLVGAALPLVHGEGAALGSVALLLVSTAALSLAVLAFPLRPRWYLASLALSSVVAVSSWALG